MRIGRHFQNMRQHHQIKRLGGKWQLFELINRQQRVAMLRHGSWL